MIRKIKIKNVEGHPACTEITDEKGNEILCHFPVDVHITDSEITATITLDVAELEIDVEVNEESFSQLHLRTHKNLVREKKL